MFKFIECVFSEIAIPEFTSTVIMNRSGSYEITRPTMGPTMILISATISCLFFRRLYSNFHIRKI
jgi:hypothetical protein